MTESNALLELSGVAKSFPGAGAPTVVLEDVDLTVNAGDSVAIVGPSGCGKSTLLNLIGALDKPTSGTIEFDGRDLTELNEAQLAEFRNASIGFVFQLHHLLPQCTAIENVLIPTLVRKGDDARARAAKLLERVGLADRTTYRPGLLSGGERQRVAVVRALINNPSLLLADEPTGSLSEEGALELTDLLLELKRDENMTLIVVTHALAVAEKMDRVFELKSGRLQPFAGAATV